MTSAALGPSSGGTGCAPVAVEIAPTCSQPISIASFASSAPSHIYIAFADFALCLYILQEIVSVSVVVYIYLYRREKERVGVK